MKLKKMFIAITMSLMVFHFGSIAWAKPVKGLMMYWRGETDCAKGFRAGLAQLGYEVSATEFDAAQDKEKLDRFLESLDETQYDFIYTFGTTVSTKAAKRVTNTPIFYGIVTNPVKAGLIKSWESSGNNTTGVSHAIPYEDQVDFLLSLGSFKTVGMVYNPSEKNSQIALEELGRLLKAKGVAFAAEPVDSEQSIENAVSNLISKKPGLIYLPSDSFIQTNGVTIISKINNKNIPTYAALPKYLESGAMIGVVSSYHSVGMELANNADRVLKGSAPSSVPSKTLPLSMQKIKLNTKTAERIGADIPYYIISNAEIIK